MSDQDDTERPHEATPRKLDEARKRGELPRTADLTAAAAMAGLLALTLLPGGWVPTRLGTLGTALLDHATTVGPALLDGGTAFSGTLLREIGVALAPAMILPVIAIFAVLFAVRGLVLAPEKLEPKLSRISPLSNAKNKFGPTGIMEFLKSTVKLCIYGTILWLYLLTQMPVLLAALSQGPGPVSALMMHLMVEFMALVVLVMIGIGGVDYLWQVFDHKRRQRMSHQELREDHKQAEGDPHVKQQRRQRGTELAMNKMLGDVPHAAVVIVNPTHFAVALKWSPDSLGAPICVAKGTDEVAAKIRGIARDAKVPIHSDPPTARALFATTRIGQEIAPDHYQAVAAAIRFAEAMRLRAQSLRSNAPQPANPAPRPSGQTKQHR